MKCFDPVLCYTSDTGKRIFRNHSLASDIIKRVHQKRFDCGKCLNCRKKKARELATRCTLHASMYTHNCFITLTYDESKEGYHNELSYSDIQKFKKRLRQRLNRLDGRRIQLFNVHEYGKNGKKHWHLICFNYSPKDKELYTIKNGVPLYTSEELSKDWGHGFITIGDVNEATAMYQAQYTQKDIKNGHEKNEKRKSKSNHSGIGKEWFMKNYRNPLMLGYIPNKGHKVALPRYFERIAHKHYSHFYEKINFHDTPDRKAIHRPFKPEEKPNKEMADLYIHYRDRKEKVIEELEEDWRSVIIDELENNIEPTFIRSGENALYELNKMQKKEIF